MFPWICPVVQAGVVLVELSGQPGATVPSHIVRCSPSAWSLRCTSAISQKNISRLRMFMLPVASYMRRMPSTSVPCVDMLSPQLLVGGTMLLMELVNCLISFAVISPLRLSIANVVGFAEMTKQADSATVAANVL